MDWEIPIQDVMNVFSTSKKLRAISPLRTIKRRQKINELAHQQELYKDGDEFVLKQKEKGPSHQYRLYQQGVDDSVHFRRTDRRHLTRMAMTTYKERGSMKIRSNRKSSTSRRGRRSPPMFLNELSHLQGTLIKIFLDSLNGGGDANAPRGEV